jgi:hypothetical protein
MLKRRSLSELDGKSTLKLLTQAKEQQQQTGESDNEDTIGLQLFQDS